MSGPIVRSGPNPKYSSNWEQAFGKKKKADKPAAKSKKEKAGKKSKKS